MTSNDSKTEKPFVSIDEWYVAYMPLWKTEDVSLGSTDATLKRSYRDYSDPIDFDGYIYADDDKKHVFYEDVIRKGGRDWCVQIGKEHVQRTGAIKPGEENADDVEYVLFIGSPSGRTFQTMVKKSLGKISRELAKKIVDELYPVLANVLNKPRHPEHVDSVGDFEEMFEIGTIIQRCISESKKWR